MNPKINSYRCSVEKLELNLGLLKPTVVQRECVTDEYLSSLSRKTDCIIVTFSQIHNNINIFRRCKSMFKSIEISAQIV
jgi:hypothetical protein